MRFSKAVPRLLELLEDRKYFAYQDGGGVWTCGIGHTRGVGPDTKADDAKIDEWLRQDLMVCDAAIKKLVTRNLTQGQMDALGLFVFNVGVAAFARSTLLKRLNAGALDAARDELNRWVHDEGERVRGLDIRRCIEAFVWNGLASKIDAKFLHVLQIAMD